MKATAITLSLLLFLSLAFASAASEAESAVVETDIILAEVDGMVCAFCACGIDRTIARLEGAKDTYIDLEKQVVAVEREADSGLGLETVKKAIIDSGFEVSSIAFVSKSLEEIRAERES
jgi:mercuric ion binding protein